MIDTWYILHFRPGERRVPCRTNCLVILVSPQSLLLNKEDGCTTFRQFVKRLSAGDGTCTQALCVFREKAITLLFLERDALRHYPESDRQVRGVKIRSFSLGQSSIKTNQLCFPVGYIQGRRGVRVTRDFVCAVSGRRHIHSKDTRFFILCWLRQMSIASYHVDTDCH